MTNIFIAENFDLLAKLMELYDQDNFKIRAYQNAARLIKNAPENFSEMTEAEIFQQPGIGKAIGKKIMELLQNGSIEKLDELIANTPAGIIEMLAIKGLGVKKIKTIWKELNIVTAEDLLNACKQNLLSNVKGFGIKSQKNIEEALEYYLNNQDKFLLATVLNFAKQIDDWFKKNIPDFTFLLSGNVYKQDDVIETLLWITNADEHCIKQIQTTFQLKEKTIHSNEYEFIFENGLPVKFILCDSESLEEKQFEHSCNDSFFEKFISMFDIKNKTEKEIFSDNQLSFIPPFLRNNIRWIEKAKMHQMPVVIETDDIKGIIHCHSNWSDGGNSIEEIANELQENNWEYLVLTDHSKSAFYANGLKENRVMAQHTEIDNWNKKMPDFKIFKGIESDILNDGSLDYSNEILATFDVVIASVHSNLRMNETLANERIIKAIENPFTNILGHMTGRLLLMRNGYPVNHQKIIDACAANNVAIELNANPRRLDIDWQFIDYALEKNVLISINPDAHNLKGIYDIHYGVLAAQKAGLTKENNLSSFSLKNFEDFLTKQYLKRP